MQRVRTLVVATADGRGRAARNAVDPGGREISERGRMRSEDMMAASEQVRPVKGVVGKFRKVKRPGQCQIFGGLESASANAHAPGARKNSDDSASSPARLA